MKQTVRGRRYKSTTEVRLCQVWAISAVPLQASPRVIQRVEVEAKFQPTYSLHTPRRTTKSTDNAHKATWQDLQEQSDRNRLDLFEC